MSKLFSGAALAGAVSIFLGLGIVRIWALTRPPTPTPEAATAEAVVSTPESVPGIDFPIRINGLGIQVLSAIRADKLVARDEVITPENPDDEILAVQVSYLGGRTWFEFWPTEYPAVSGQGFERPWGRVFFNEEEKKVFFIFFIPKGGPVADLTLRLPEGVEIPLPGVLKVLPPPPGEQA